MSEVELLSPPEDHCCRYCLSDENCEDLVAPCKCDGSSKFVHKACLREWFNKRNSSVVIPGRFNQFANIYNCEICNTEYKTETVSRSAGESLNKKILVYITTITFILLCCYASIGTLMAASANTKHLFIEYDNKFENAMANGFFMTHLVIGIFYIVMGIIAAASDGPGCCIVCYCPDGGGDDCNDCGGVIIIVLIIIGILGTVLAIYFDVIARVVDRHKMKQIEVLDIHNHEEGSCDV
jgi:E3 ubiquitin-protein ligase DOA10